MLLYWSNAFSMYRTNCVHKKYEDEVITYFVNIEFDSMVIHIKSRSLDAQAKENWPKISSIISFLKFKLIGYSRFCAYIRKLLAFVWRHHVNWLLVIPLHVYLSTHFFESFLFIQLFNGLNGSMGYRHGFIFSFDFNFFIFLPLILRLTSSSN